MSKTPPPRLFFTLIAAVLVFVIGRNLYRRYMNNALVDAVEANDAVRVRSLLDRGADANVENSRRSGGETGTPVLSMAMDNLRGLVTESDAPTAPEEVACLLIAHGAHIHDSPGDRTDLEAAADYGSVSVVRCLLEHGANPATVDNNRQTALDAAFVYGSAKYSDAARNMASDAARRLRVSREMTALLRRHGARFTPLQAVEVEDASLLTQTLQAGGDVNAHNQEGETALYAAASRGSVPMMQILLAHGANVNGYARFIGVPLDAAASGGSPDAVKLLLVRGANINVAGREEASPLVNAITARHTDIARLLLANHADPNLEQADGFAGNALTAAARSLPELVPELLAHHADINADDGAALRAAISAHHPDLVRYLLAHGARTYPAFTRFVLKTEYTKRGAGTTKVFTPMPSTLRTAVTNGPESFDLLTQAGATLGDDKAYILLAAASAGHAVLYDRLIALGANVNAVDAQGNTPLTEALRYAPAGIQTLLDHGANPNVVTRSRQTPLLIAVQAGNADVVRLLLARGAAPGLKPPRSHTALYFARRHPIPAIIRLLEQAGAKAE